MNQMGLSTSRLRAGFVGVFTVVMISPMLFRLLQSYPGFGRAH